MKRTVSVSVSVKSVPPVAFATALHSLCRDTPAATALSVFIPSSTASNVAVYVVGREIPRNRGTESVTLITFGLVGSASDLVTRGFRLIIFWKSCRVAITSSTGALMCFVEEMTEVLSKMLRSATVPKC